MHIQFFSTVTEFCPHHHILRLEHCPHPQKETPYPLSVQSDLSKLHIRSQNSPALNPLGTVTALQVKSFFHYDGTRRTSHLLMTSSPTSLSSSHTDLFSALFHLRPLQMGIPLLRALSPSCCYHQLLLWVPLHQIPLFESFIPFLHPVIILFIYVMTFLDCSPH